MRNKILSILIILCTLYLAISAIYHMHQTKDLEDKVKFYERVMEDFGIEEFINYPELYYEDGYVEQVKVHNCM